MATVNKVMLLGNLTRDPETKSLPSGATLCQFALAMNRRFKGQDGQQKDEATFVDVTAWGRTAEICMQYLRKGRSAVIEGRLTQDRWQDKETGKNRSRLYVTAERVTLLGGRDGQDDGGGGGAPQEQQAQGPEDDIPF